MQSQQVIPQSKIGNQIRSEITRLRAERQTQIKAMSQILSASSKMAINYDKLVQEVSETLQEDL